MPTEIGDVLSEANVALAHLQSRLTAAEQARDADRARGRVPGTERRGVEEGVEDQIDRRRDVQRHIELERLFSYSHRVGSPAGSLSASTQRKSRILTFW